MNIFCLLLGGSQFFRWWWVVVDVLWLVVAGGGYIWLVFGGGGWWWMVVGGGIVWPNCFFLSFLCFFSFQMLESVVDLLFSWSQTFCGFLETRMLEPVAIPPFFVHINCSWPNLLISLMKLRQTVIINTDIAVCNFQSMKSSVELNRLLSKFFCYTSPG